MNLIWQCWLLVWTMGEGCYMQDGFYWWLCRSMNLQVQVCEWHNHASQVEWALRICAYAHMHMWVYALRWRRTYQALPSGEMDGEGCRMKERTMTVETEPLLARIFGWWAMFLLFFPNWVLLWWLAVLRASYEFAWLAASKERNKIGILNLFLLVSWTTMSYYFSKCGFSLWQWFWSMVSMMYELASKWIICWRRGVRVRTCFWTSSCSWSLLWSMELSCDGFSQCGFIVNNWLGNEFLQLYFTDGRRSLFGSLAIQWWYLMLTVIGLRGVFEYAVR